MSVPNNPGPQIYAVDTKYSTERHCCSAYDSTYACMAYITALRVQTPKCIRNLLSTYVSTQATSKEHISKDRDANQIAMHTARILHAFLFLGEGPGASILRVFLAPEDGRTKYSRESRVRGKERVTYKQLMIFLFFFRMREME